MSAKSDPAAIRVLVVDDSTQMLGLMRAFLETMEAVEIVGTASDGYEALEQAELLSPDLILMDLQMPRMDGLEATRQLRKRFPAIKVLIVTSHDTPEARKASLRAGAAGYVPKNRLKQALPAEIRRLFPPPGK